MIELRLKVDFESRGEPFVVKLDAAADAATRSARGPIAIAQRLSDGNYHCESKAGNFRLRIHPGTSIDGDVLLCLPENGIAERIFRRESRHNTLLFTERCDQMCVMCSQPPREVDYSWRFDLYEQALRLFDKGAKVGVSGGEPTLYKDELLTMIESTNRVRPDLSYQILSNAQHFRVSDQSRLVELHKQVDLTWAIPLYSHQAETHDRIVGKEGAFNPLMQNLYLLGGADAKIELRTVITAQNFMDLPQTATFVAKHLRFISDWAVMAMEPIGFAKANREQLFFDHSAFPEPLVEAARICKLLGVSLHFFNVPRCTVPPEVRSLCVDSISDWKRKFLPACSGCNERDQCCGFFEWYSDRWAWSEVRPITGSELQ